MAQTGIHLLSSLTLNKYALDSKWSLSAILMGAIIPDIDIIIVYLSSFFFNLEYSKLLFHQTFSHSFFTIAILYLLIAIVSELKKNRLYKYYGKSLVLGMIIHIMFDTLFHINEIHLFWPLPIGKINLWDFLNIKIKNTLLSLEFIFFRIYSWILIKLILSKSNTTIWYLKYLNLWMSWELYFFLISILVILFSFHIFEFIFIIMYTISIIMALNSTLILYRLIDNELNQKQD